MTPRAPFPWFGGKRRVAPIVWQAFGADINNYVEPFAGSLAVLLGRPGGAGKIETVNDLDRYVANFWRAVAADPEAVAQHADWPVNEADLHARHRWLVNQREFRERMHTEPEYFDVKIAGWWVWGICQWIGGGWCTEPQNHKHPKLDGIGKGVHSNAGHADSSNWRKRPELDGTAPGRGVHSDAGHALSRQLPRLSVTDGASGLGGPHSHNLVANAYSPGNLPGIGNDRGINGVSAAPCADWFRALQVRLRRVRVACGDWTRVLGPSVLGKGKNVGGRRPCAVFLDPPYDPELRAVELYGEDAAGLSAEVRRWALEHGDDPDLRIALCGYAGEHEMPASWTEHAWQAARGYAAEGNDNRDKERIWFSPHCIPLQQQGQLFAQMEVSRS